MFQPQDKISELLKSYRARKKFLNVTKVEDTLNQSDHVKEKSQWTKYSICGLLTTHSPKKEKLLTIYFSLPFYCMRMLLAG